MIDLFFVTFAVAFTLAIVLILAVTLSRSAESGKRVPIRRQRYVPGQFSEQMELDMRLPYRRFKQLYPDTNMTYADYKNLQTRTAFKRSMSSQDNKRMVR